MRDAGCGMRKPRVHDWRDAGEAPLLLLRGGEAELREERDRALAELFEPRVRTSGAVSGKRLERCEVETDVRHATGAASRSQSYPFSSSSSASSLPPDFTLRPSASTCTKSGRMWLSIRSWCGTTRWALSGRRAFA